MIISTVRLGVGHSSEVWRGVRVGEGMVQEEFIAFQSPFIILITQGFIRNGLSPATLLSGGNAETHLRDMWVPFLMRARTP